MRTNQTLPEAYAQLLRTLEWLKEPRTIRDMSEHLEIDVRTARNWVDGWCQKGWIRATHFVRPGGRGRPSMAYETDTPPVDMMALLGAGDGEAPQSPSPWVFNDQLRDFFREPRTLLEYRQFADVTWPTAKVHLSRWVKAGNLYDSGFVRVGRAPPAQSYCADAEATRRGVLRHAAIEFEHWLKKHPGADIDIWER